MQRPRRVTVAELLRLVEQRLRRARLSYGHGTHNAHDEAAWLVRASLGLQPTLTPATLARVASSTERRLVQRRLEQRVHHRSPLAYLLREAWLGDVRFYVDRRAIVPRSYIAELLRERLSPWLRQPVRRALDLCTGSGCLAVLLARTFPRARVDASDLSAAALAVARINIARHRLRRRIRLLRSDLFAELGDQRYDLIVCNPPYVTARAMRRLPREYRHEPRLALAGGGDGLALLHRLFSQARQHLNARGLLVCEIGGNRRALQRAYPQLPFAWPLTSAGAGSVFVLEREQLPG
jgi:ribosomal protein L3 glutamine methyltransferase